MMESKLWILCALVLLGCEDESGGPGTSTGTPTGGGGTGATGGTGGTGGMTQTDIIR